MNQPSSQYNLIGQKLKERMRKRALFLLKVDKRIKWMGAGMFCFVLFSVLSYFPEFTEKYYSQKLFIVIRYFYDYTLGILPFSSTIWLNLIFFCWLSFKVFKYIRFNFTNKEVSVRNRVQYSLLSMGSFAGTISVIFFVGWGFNYYRTPIEDYTGIGIKSLTPQEITREANLARKLAIDARENISELPMDKPFHAGLLPKDLESEMRDNLEHVLRMMGYPTPGRVRCRVLNNDYWLRRIGYTGIYVSFYGEALVSDKISPIYRPFFYAHEMAHAYGFFDEADANFLAYMACQQSEDPAIVYSGRIAHLIYIGNEFDLFRLNLPRSVMTDLQSNGSFSSQEEYNRMILLVHAWRQKYPLKLVKPIHLEAFNRKAE